MSSLSPFAGFLRAAWLSAVAFCLASPFGVAELHARAIGIAAIVNGEPITTHDLDQRIRMLRLSADDFRSDASVFESRALSSLVDESLQLQEAERLGFGVAQADIDSAFARLAKNNAMEAKAFAAMLDDNGVDVATMHKRLASELVWPEVIRRLFAQQAQVDDAVLDAEKSRIRQELEIVSLQLDEILIPAGDNDDEALGAARNLVSELRRGRPFAEAARALSKAPSASSGGALGWLRRNEIDDRRLRELDKAGPGGVTDPIRVEGGFLILNYAALRDPDHISSVYAPIALSQISFDLPAEGEEAKRREANRLLRSLEGKAADVKSCGDAEALTRHVGAGVVEEIAERPFGSLPPAIRSVIGSTGKGGLSRPTVLDSKLVIFVICDRRAAPPPLPAEERIRQNLENARLVAFAERHLRDLRQDAIVERLVDELDRRRSGRPPTLAPGRLSDRLPDRLRVER